MGDAAVAPVVDEGPQFLIGNLPLKPITLDESGDETSTTVQMELQLMDGAGAEHVLDAVEKSGIINPGV